MVNFAVVGLGVGSSRARMIKNTKGAELKCVVDLNEALAKRIAEELDTEWTPNLDDILGTERYRLRDGDDAKRDPRSTRHPRSTGG